MGRADDAVLHDMAGGTGGTEKKHLDSACDRSLDRKELKKTHKPPLLIQRLQSGGVRSFGHFYL
jgi:hypothetical protein